MKSAPFHYARPDTLAEAISLLAQGEGASSAILGGQSLLVLMGLRLTAIETLVDVSRLKELNDLRDIGETIFLGAATTHAAIEDGRVPDPSNGLLSRVAGKIAYRAVRNLGTIGGSIALADPSADWPACLIALGATVVIEGPSGGRREAMASFVKGPYQTSLGAGELILGFDIRKRPQMRWGAAKVQRKSGAFADSMAVAVRSPEHCAVVLTGTDSHARPLPEMSSALRQGVTSMERLRELAESDLAEIDPTADPYRMRCHIATVTRAVQEALQ